MQGYTHVSTREYTWAQTAVTRSQEAPRGFISTYLKGKWVLILCSCPCSLWSCVSGRVYGFDDANGGQGGVGLHFGAPGFCTPTPGSPPLLQPQFGAFLRWASSLNLRASQKSSECLRICVYIFSNEGVSKNLLNDEHAMKKPPNSLQMILCVWPSQILEMVTISFLYGWKEKYFHNVTTASAPHITQHGSARTELCAQGSEGTMLSPCFLLEIARASESWPKCQIQCPLPGWGFGSRKPNPLPSPESLFLLLLA